MIFRKHKYFSSWKSKVAEKISTLMNSYQFRFSEVHSINLSEIACSFLSPFDKGKLVGFFYSTCQLCILQSFSQELFKNVFILIISTIRGITLT